MEEAAGTQLGKLWHEMKVDDKLKVVDEVVAVQKKLLSVSFTRLVLDIYHLLHTLVGCNAI